tara:strand:- start:1502 stop:1729 length:228 start_codon:yes stop_codon:yes gene_type:complete
MIKYDTSKISRANQLEMKEQLVLFKSQLKGMHCKMHPETDSIIAFRQDEYNVILPTVNACCSTFQDRIKRKLGLQ